MSRSDVALVLVDFDDTLVDTAPRFQNARRSLFALLQSLGIDEELARQVHHDRVDPRMLEQHGLGPRRLQYSFPATYEALCAELGVPALTEIVEQCAALGRAVVGAPPVLNGAVEALRRLAEAFPTALFTQAADAEYQLSCVQAVGVHEIVGPDRVVVCERKTVSAFQAALDQFEVPNPADVWMIGNSIRSDINPALEAGARAILVEVDDPWEFDLVEPVSHDFVRVRSFPEAVDYLFGIER